MIAEWVEQVSAAEFLGWTGASLAAIGGAVVFAKKAVPAFRKAVRSLQLAIDLADALVTLPDDIKFIKHELEANSGKTVKDIATRTEVAVADVAAELSHVKRQVASLKTTTTKTNRRLAEHLSAASD